MKAAHSTQALGVSPLSSICSHNEWDSLEAVVVGTTAKAQFSRYDVSVEAIAKVGPAVYGNRESLPYDPRILEEAEEDLSRLVGIFESLGVLVYRPEPLDHSRSFGTPDWSTDGFYSYCPRDSLLVVGETVIEAPMAMRGRYFETFAYRRLLAEAVRKGTRWLAAPKPRLLDSIFLPHATNEQLALLDDEPVFDAANVLRVGKDLIYLVSDTGNELGCRWLQSALGSQYRVHPCRNLYNSIHIDSTIALLRPGLALVNPERVRDDNLPAPLRDWDLIRAPEMVDIGLEGEPLPWPSSVWIGMNLLMVNPSLAIVDAKQTELHRLLERHRIDVIPFALRHARTLGGGSIARRWIFVGGGSSKAILDGATARSQLSEVAAKRNGVSLLLARDNQRQPLMVIAARVLNLSIGQTIKFLADGDTRFLDGLHEAVGTTYLRPIP